MKTKKAVGSVTPEERDEIQNLFERKSAITELFKSLPDINKESYDSIYEKLVTDLGRTTRSFQGWWDDKGHKYSWESHPEGHWEIEFETCEIFLVH